MSVKIKDLSFFMFVQMLMGSIQSNRLRKKKKARESSGDTSSFNRTEDLHVFMLLCNVKYCTSLNETQKKLGPVMSKQNCNQVLF